jgi:hydroxypyruvate isomerase
VPDRHEPDSAGEINYPYIFSILEHEGYDKWIGLEYKPKEGTMDGLQWIKDFGFDL